MGAALTVNTRVRAEHIGSKTAVQIRSHAQKFFSKVERNGGARPPICGCTAPPGQRPSHAQRAWLTDPAHPTRRRYRRDSHPAAAPEAQALAAVPPQERARRGQQRGDRPGAAGGRAVGAGLDAGVGLCRRPAAPPRAALPGAGRARWASWRRGRCGRRGGRVCRRGRRRRCRGGCRGRARAGAAAGAPPACSRCACCPCARPPACCAQPRRACGSMSGERAGQGQRAL